MVTPDSHRVCAPWYLGIWLRCIQILLTRLSRSLVCLSRQFNYLYTIPYCQSRNPPVLHRSLDCSAFARRYLRNLCNFFSCPYLDVSVRGVPRSRLRAAPRLTPGGFPHSDTAGSQLRGSSPTSIATMYVLLRLQHPRHPSSALMYINAALLLNSLHFSRC